MEEDTNSDVIQVVNSESTFSRNLLDEHLSSWDPSEIGKNYTVVAIMGCQSGGKSTLLNGLFNTKFATMDTIKGRFQTTRGIWAGRAHCTPILVLDVEGTDSRERGESHASFERKTSLFSLALADVLLINMWYGMFVVLGSFDEVQTIFEIDLKLFQVERTRKCSVVFVLRDHHGVELDQLRELLLKDVNTIFDSVHKPAGIADTISVNDLFTFEFVALPNFVLQEREFTNAVGILRDRFYDSSREDFLCPVKKNSENRVEHVPLDGFSLYAEGVWNMIMSEQDLDLPSQRELFAHLRCEEMKEAVTVSFVKELSVLVDTVEKGDFVRKLGIVAQALVENSVAEYDERSAQYKETIAIEKRTKLCDEMYSRLRSLMKRQIECISDVALAAVRRGCDDVGADDLDALPSLRVLLKEQSEFLLEEAHQSTIPAVDLEEEIVSHLELFAAAAEAVIESKRAQMVDAIMGRIVDDLCSRLTGPLEKFLIEALPTMWKSVRDLLGSERDHALKEAHEIESILNCTDEEKDRWGKRIVEGSVECVVKETRNAAKNLMFVLQKRFDREFKYENGVPRIWSRRSPVLIVYRAARDEAIKLIDRFAVVRVSSDLSECVEILSREQRVDLEEKFTLYAEDAFKFAEQMKQASFGYEHIPWWFWMVLFALGFNEAKAIVTNPILLFPILLVSIASFVLHKLNLLNLVVDWGRGVFMQIFKQWTADEQSSSSPPVRSSGSAKEDEMVDCDEGAEK